MCNLNSTYIHIRITHTYAYARSLYNVHTGYVDRSDLREPKTKVDAWFIWSTARARDFESFEIPGVVHREKSMLDRRKGERTKVTESRSTGTARWDKSISFWLVYFACAVFMVSTFRGCLPLHGRDLYARPFARLVFQRWTSLRATNELNWEICGNHLLKVNFVQFVFIIEVKYFTINF